MKTHDLMNAFGDIEEQYLAEAAASNSEKSDSTITLNGKPEKIRIAKEPMRIRARRTAFTAAAVACALAVGTIAGTYIRPSQLTSTPNSSTASLDDSSELLSADLTPITAEHKYYTLNEIRAMAETTVLSNDKLSIEKVRIGSGDKMPIYQTEPFKQDFKQAEGLVKHLFGDDFDFDDPNNREYFEHDNTEEPGRSSVWFTNNGSDPNYSYDAQMYCLEDGTLVMGSEYISDGIKYENPEFAEIEKLYALNMGDELDGASYRMADGQEWSVADAAAYSLELANTYFAALENYDFTYEITDLSVRKFSSDYGYVVNMQRVDKNGNLYDNHRFYTNRSAEFDDILTFKYNSDSWLAEGNPWLYESEVQIMFVQKEAPLKILKSETPCSGRALSSGEKLISLEEAIDIITKAPRRGNENHPAFEGKLEFSTAELEYYSVCIGTPEYTGPDYIGPLSDPEKLNGSEYAQLRPYWAFTMADNYVSTPNESDGKCYPSYKNYGLYLVDAVTGALHII